MTRPERLTAAQLLAALTATPAKPSDLSKALSVSRATVHRRLESLLNEGLVVRVGDGPTASYRVPTSDEELARSRPVAAGQVRLVMNNTAAYAVQSALDLYARIGLGQLKEIESRARFGELRRADGEELTLTELDQLEQLTEAMRFHLLGLTGGASYGIYGPKVHPDVLRTWGLQRALRHRIAWDGNPKGSMGVWHDEPLNNDTITGLFVHSDQPDAKGAPTRYVMEMPADCVKLLRDALNVSLQVLTGEFSVIVDLARNQILRHSDLGGPVPESALSLGAAIAAKMQAVLSSGSSGAYNVVLSSALAHVLEVLKAFEQFQHSGERAHSSGASTTGTTVEPVGDSPWALTLDELPQGMLLNFKGGQYRVIAPTGEDHMLAIVASSHSWKTAVQMANNYAAGGRGRALDF
jgi:hypothetical protein